MQGTWGNMDTAQNIVRDGAKEPERERVREGDVDEQLKSWITACPPGLRQTKQNKSVTGAK